MMNHICRAISRIRQSGQLLSGDRLDNRYDQYHEIKPSGTVKDAWAEVGKYLRDAINKESEE